MEMRQEISWKLMQHRGVWYAREAGGKRSRISLRTKDEEQAKLNLKKELGEEILPEENVKHFELGKAHLVLSNPALIDRTFGQLYKKWYGQKHLGHSSKKRRIEEVGRGLFAKIRDYQLCDPKAKAIIEAATPELGIYAREVLGELQRFALKIGWALVPFVTPIFIAISHKERRKTRAITHQEHEAFVTHERASATRPNAKYGTERADYYDLLFLTGAAQTDGANLKATHIDWKAKELVFHRQKTGERCAIALGGRLEELLKRLPKEGQLFPNLCKLDQQKRGRDFRRHVKRMGLDKGEESLTLHSYRYHMAEWCCEVGMEMRYAQIILGHSSKTVANAYARKCKKAAPTPDTYQKAPVADIIDGKALVA
jgi:hypothetical protein